MWQKKYSRRKFLKDATMAIGLAAISGCVKQSKNINKTFDEKAFAIEKFKASKADRFTPLVIPSWYYQNFNGDLSLEVPEEAVVGWKKANLTFPRERMALVVMHVWNMGTKEKYPNWWRLVPWAVRAKRISETVFPRLLTTAREAKLTLFHVAGGSNAYWEKYDGYKITKSLSTTIKQKINANVPSDELSTKIAQFRYDNTMIGLENEADVNEGFKNMDFAPQAMPLPTEPIASTSEELLDLCRAHNINHLVYCGFVINWCLRNSPGGMVDMSRYGLLCSVIKQATTAAECKETAREELHKKIAMWHVAVEYGFVYDLDDFLMALFSDRQ